MKKVYSLLIVTLVMLLLPIQALAVDFSFEKMDIDAELLENGDVHVIEKQTYQFDSAFNGITRTLIPQEGTDIVDVEARENNESLKIKQDGNEYKIHRKGKNETITVEVAYTIKEGVDVYSDVAEFYWPFFDTGNESDYEQFEVTVHPPQSTDDVIAFGYDAAEESAEIESDSNVYFDLGYVSSGEKGDIRVAYDKNLFPSASITNDKPMRGKIEAEQQRLIDERIMFEEQKSTLGDIAPYIIGVLAVVFIGLLFFARQKKQTVMREVERRFPSPYFVPEEVMSLPATIFYMKHDMVQPDVLSAALMDLVRKGYVEEKNGDSFKVMNRNTTHQHETLLIQWLFDEIGNDGTFKMEDLKTYTDVKKNQETYQKDYTKWQKAVRNEKSDYHLFFKNIKARLIIGAIGLLIIPFIVFLAIYELFMLMTFGIFLAIGFLVFAALFKTHTVMGARIKRDWQAFQDMYPGMADDEWDELVTDDQKRAFIYGVGIKDKKIEQKNELLLNRFPTEDYPATNPMSFLLFATMFNGSFNHAHTTSAASAGSSPGAGGGTGVGGGGGGSGAF